VGSSRAQPRTRGGYRHEALTYGSEDELLATAVPFLRDGVAAGEPVLLRLEAPLRDAILDALGDDAGGVTVVPHAVPLTPLATLRTMHERLERLTAAAGARARLLGDVPHEPWPAWARYEAASNVLFDPLPVWAVCPYDVRETPAAVLADVERTHPALATTDLGGLRSPHFQDPLTFLEDHARRPERLPAAPPDTELVDPSPRWAGEIVAILAEDTLLEAPERDGLRLGTAAVVANAHEHGRPPVLVRVWTEPEQVTVTVADAGLGTDDLLRGVLPDGPSAEDCHSLFQVREAVDDVWLFWGPDGFTVRLAQRRA